MTKLIDGTGQNATQSFDQNAVLTYFAEVSVGKSIFIISFILIAIVSLIFGFIADRRFKDSNITFIGFLVFLFSLLLVSGSIFLDMPKDHTESSQDKTVNIFTKGVGANEYKNSNKEFKIWANQRYGLELNDSQAATLQEKKVGNSTEGFSEEIIVDGKIIKSWIKNDRITLMESENNVKELETNAINN